MKFSALLILPCFLTVGAVSFASYLAFDPTPSVETTTESIVARSSTRQNGNAHRGSGRREMLASMANIQVAN